MIDSQRFNAAVLEEIIEMERAGDKGLVAFVVGDFLGKFDARLDDIESALSTAQWSQVELLAHALGSSCFFLGLERSGRLARNIEGDARLHTGSLQVIFSLRTEIDLAALEMEQFVRSLAEASLFEDSSKDLSSEAL